MTLPAEREFFRGPVVTTASDDQYRIASKPAEPGYATGQPFEMTRTATELTYCEGDELVFSGRRIGPGMQVYVPSGPTPLFYTSLLHRVSGNAFGKQAEGFLWLDHCYLSPGVTWRNSGFFKGVELAWTPFGTEFTDGSIEMGHICYGADGFNFAMIVNGDGEVLHSTSNVDARDIKYKPNTFPEHMYYEVDGLDWEWSAVDDGELPEQASGHDFYRSSEGYLRRAGETRTPAVYHSYNEFFPPAISAWGRRDGSSGGDHRQAGRGALVGRAATAARADPRRGGVLAVRRGRPATDTAMRKLPPMAAPAEPRLLPVPFPGSRLRDRYSAKASSTPSRSTTRPGCRISATRTP